jgi:hypothetical protein
LGEREPIFMVFKPEFDSVIQVDVLREYDPVSPLSLRERARVRGSCSSTRSPFIP